MYSTSSSSPLILEQTHGDVAFIGINRPHVRNCIDSATARDLKDALQRFEADDNLRSAILHGVGGNFCSGYDLKELSGVGQSLKDDADATATSLTLESFLASRHEDPIFRPMGPSKLFLSKPLVGAISGYAVAGGLELALLCDVRFLEENAILGVFCRRFGVPLLDGGTVRLPAIVGYGRAMEMVLTGRPVTAKEALQWGLANGVVATGTALGVALNFARWGVFCKMLG
jgi:enoyl-CoA hydratase/carnithine racemase